MARQPLYNPALLSKDELKSTFIARKTTFDELVDHIAKHKPGEPCRHLIIVGSRGMGKTTLGLRVLYEIEDNSTFCSNWQPVLFNEESYEICDAADFWLASLSHLSHAVNDNTWSEYSEKMVASEPDSVRLEAYALDALNEYYEETKKRVILFVENIDSLFEQFKSEREIHAIRAAIMTNPRLLLLGTANSTFSGIQKYSNPFYGFFQPFRLRGLGRCEAEQLIEAIVRRSAEREDAVDLSLARSRIEAIRRLTGGNPRSISMAAQMLIETPMKGADVLETLIDEQTPYFKARIEELPIQARKVFNQLANGWCPMLAREVGAMARLGTSQTSAQLRILISRGYAREVRLKGESRIRYEVCDRFFNIYHLFRLSRSSRERLRRLVQFLYEIFGDAAIPNIYLSALSVCAETHSSATDVSQLLSSVTLYIISNEDAADKRQFIDKIMQIVDESDQGRKTDNSDALDTYAWVRLGKWFQRNHCLSDALLVYAYALQISLLSIARYNQTQVNDVDDIKKSIKVRERIQLLVKDVLNQVTRDIDLDELSTYDRLVLGCLNGTIGACGMVAREDLLAANVLGWALRCSDIERLDSEEERKWMVVLLVNLLKMIAIYPKLCSGNEQEEIIECLLKMKKPKDQSWHENVFVGLMFVGRKMVSNCQYDLLEKLCMWVIREFPENNEGWRLYAAWTLGQTNDMRYTEAKKYVNKVLAARPNDPHNHHIAFLVGVVRREWNDALMHLEACFKLDSEFGEGKWSAHADLLIRAACAGKQRKVREIIENSILNHELEPLRYALQQEEDLDSIPLPREIVEAAKHIRSKLNGETGNEH